MIRIIIIFFYYLLIVGCVSNSIISVQNDGSAIVKTTIGYDFNEMKKYYYESDIITNIDTNFVWVTFKIENIDSLGYYLPNISRGYFRFRMKDNTFSVTDGNKEVACKDELFCSTVYIYIKFEKDIQNFESVNRITRKKDNRTILIKKTRRQLIKGKKKTDVAIKIE